MLLTVDVGNTNTNFGIFNRRDILKSFSVMTKTQRTADEFGMLIRSLLASMGLETDQIEGVIVASVVPNVMNSLMNGIRSYIYPNPIEIGVGTRTGLKLASANPKEIGADRVVDAVAAYEMFGGPIIVIDFGTATTYDLILADGRFEAGVTAPGLKLSANALWNGTAKLPEIEIKLPDTILAKETVTSMQAGLIFGCIGQTEYIVKRMKEESGLEGIKTVATGGIGQIIADATPVIEHYDRQLTLKGLQLIYEKNRIKHGGR